MALLPRRLSQPFRCPLCGNGNACGAAAGERECWCYGEKIPARVTDRIPPDAKNVACICRDCAFGVSPTPERDATQRPV